MKKPAGVLLAAVLLLPLAAIAGPDDAHGGKPHSHWYLDLPWEPAPYVGASFHLSTIESEPLNDGSFTSVSSDDSSSGFGITAGIDLTPYLGIEAGYTDSGEVRTEAQSDGSGFWPAGPVVETVAVTGYDLSVRARLPLPAAFAFVAHAGNVWWRSEQSINDAFGGTTREAEFAYGARLEYDGARPLRLGLGYRQSQFDKARSLRKEEDLKILALSAAYLF